MGTTCVTPSPESSTIELGPLSIHFYGLTLLVAIAAAVAITGVRWTRRGGDWDLIFRVAVWGVASGIVGARLYHVVTSWDELPDEWWGPFAIWKGGLGVWGGIGLGVIVGAIVAKRSGADAVHPGYGFLAENAEFAEICEASNITFIGPTAQQIRVMGDKAAARKAMTAVGVPIVPGTPGPVEDVEEALEFARSIGFPVIIKAAAGGGGKGMRVAKDADEFERSFSLARSEALSASSLCSAV